MIISKITLVILVITLVMQYKKYGIKVLLHPSFYFIVTWIISVVSFELFLLAGLKRMIVDPEILKELFLYVSFTSVCFIFWGYKNRKIYKDLRIDLKLSVPPSVFTIFSVIFFLSAFINLFFISGFDVASNRQEAIQANLELASTYATYSFSELVFNILGTLMTPFTFYGGWKFGNYYFGAVRRIKLIYLLPLFASIFTIIGGGGRAGIVSASIFFILGLLMALFSLESDYMRKLRSILSYFLIFVFLFSIYVNYVSIQRTKSSSRQNIYFTSLSSYPVLKPFFGIMEYSVFHIQGYQLRRMDSMSPELELGRRTFSFFLDFNVPIISQLMGEGFSLKSIFNMKDIDVVRSNIEASRRRLQEPNITATVYFVLYDDFGYYGVFIITFLFVGLTEKLFRALFTRKHSNFWFIIVFVAVYKLWTLTAFSHHLTGPWFNLYFYPVILIEVMNYLAKIRPRGVTVYEGG